MIEYLSRPSVAVPVACLVVYLIYSIFLAPKLRLPSLPIVGAIPGERFSYLRAKWRNTKDFESTLIASYDEHSKKEQATILSLFGNADFVYLPASHASWIVEQPESVLSAAVPHIEDLQTDYTLPDKALVRNPTHHHVINRDLTSKVGNLVPDIIEEVQHDLSEQWGTDTENWKEIAVYESMLRCIARTSNRVFVGAPLCRDPELTKAGIGFAQSIPMCSLAIRMFPKMVYPLVARLITIPNKIYTRRFFKCILPEIQQRIDQYDRRQNDPEGKNQPEKQDYLQWTLNHAKKSGDPSEYSPKMLAGRILMLNFAAIHTSTFSLTHTLFDLAASSPSNLSILCDEINSTLNGKPWSKQALSTMTKLDSTLRESMRINSFVTVALQRQVVHPDGVTTPQGIHLPCGTAVASPGHPVHQDPDIYGPDAREFKPFRFAEQRSSNEGDDTKEYLKKAKMSFPTTSSSYLAFGHGRLACPGRFFASNELKLMVAWIALNYEIEHLDTRPPDQWFGLIRTPDMKAKIRVRRRKGTV